MSSETTSGRRRRGLLDREAIVAAAVILADRDGIDSLTMRGIADELGYKVMALYNHIAGKDELLGFMADAVAADIIEPPVELDPLPTVRALAVSQREVLARHPWAAEQWLRHLPGPHRSIIMERLLAALATTDLDPQIAHYGFHAVTNHVVGYTLQDVGLTAGMSGGHAQARDFVDGLDPNLHGHTIEHVHQHLRGETGSSFEFVLDLILDGLTRAEPSLAATEDGST